MVNLTLQQQQKWTPSLCGNPYDTIYFVTNIIQLVFSFPTTFAVIIILLNRIYKAKSFSPAEVFLLQINFTDMCLFIHLLLHFLNDVHITKFSMILSILFYIPSLTARSVFLLAICVIYLAIVHPVTYMTAKSLCHWDWLVTTFGWFYALAIAVDIIIYKIDLTQPIFTVLFYSTILPIMFFSIATLKVLSSVGPSNGGKTLNPAKNKAFRIILSSLVVLLLHYVPQFYFYI